MRSSYPTYEYSPGERVSFEQKETDDTLVGIITRRPTEPEPWYIIEIADGSHAGTWCIPVESIHGREPGDNGWAWDAATVADQPDYGRRLAAYRCDNCGTVVPVDFHRSVEEPMERIKGYPCGSRWGGCGETHGAELVSDGFILEPEDNDE